MDKDVTFCLGENNQDIAPILQGSLNQSIHRKPAAKVLQRSNNLRRLVWWSVELNDFNIEYFPRNAMKGQALVDFLAKFSRFPPEVVAARIGKPQTLFVDDSFHAGGGRNPYN